MELETTTKVPVERLRMDRRNPRLIGADERVSDEAIIARLYRSAALDELLQPISTNGYMDIEPLIVICGRDIANGDLIVIEGNRRLAALRLLREPNLAGRIASTQGFPITVPRIDESLRATLDHVSVYPVASRERVRPLIGFKHINGPAKWDAYTKARFAAEWYETGRAEGIGLADIARSIGDRYNTIKRMVSTIYLLEQAEREGVFDVEDRYTRRLNFSHLYAALSRPQFAQFLGLESDWALHDPEPDQVPTERLGELRKMLIWIVAIERGRRRAAPCRRYTSRRWRMASAEQIKALLKSHIDGEDDRFFSVAMQVAAHEARHEEIA